MKLANGFTFDEEVMLCELYWPGELARRRNGKARRALRKRAADRCLTDHYVTIGRTCGTCSNRSGKVCDLFSDFYGTVKININETCTSHSERKHHV